MKYQIEDIAQISIYLKHPENIDDRIGEIALFEPFAEKSLVDKEILPITKRKWTFLHNLPWLRRVMLKVQMFIFKKFSSLVPLDRRTQEAKFKTVLALLLSQENLRELFFRTEKQCQAFFDTLQNAALSCGLKDFVLPSSNKNLTPLQISRELTWINGRGGSLIDDPPELNLQMALLKKNERNELLFKILNDLKRPPITSVVEVIKKQSQVLDEIVLTTRFGKYHVDKIERRSGNIVASYVQDAATSSIETEVPGHTRGAMNQRIAFAHSKQNPDEIIGCYSGELTTKKHVLEQILFIFDHSLANPCITNNLLNTIPADVPITEVSLLFTSLFSWNEMEKVTHEYYAIRSLDGAILQRTDKEGNSKYYRLNLYYTNIPFNGLVKFPAPGEIQGVMQDLNDESLILLSFQALKALEQSFPHTKLKELIQALHPIAKATRILHAPITAKADEKTDKLLESKNRMIDQIDAYRTLKKKWVKELKAINREDHKQKELLTTLIALWEKKRADHKALRGVDELLYLSFLAKKLNMIQTTNCKHSNDRTAGAIAAAKAQYAFAYTSGHPFLPGEHCPEEIKLFKVLYSLYLVWEEPEITSGLSMGYVGELFYRHFIQKTSETTRYLIDWVKEKPENYLGLSGYKY